MTEATGTPPVRGGSRPAYRVETERLVVRCWGPEDAALLNTAIHESWDHLAPWMPWARGERPTLDSTLALVRRWRGEFDLDQDFVYGIFSADETSVVGGTGLHTRRGANVREIGYWVHVSQIGQGYATEVAGALTRIAFEVDGVRKVDIYCLPHNVRSAAVARKLGFTYEATLRQTLAEGDGTFSDGMLWTMLADEYATSPASRAQVKAFDIAGRRIL